MDKYIYDENNGLWYELQGDYYLHELIYGEDMAWKSLKNSGTAISSQWSTIHLSCKEYENRRELICRDEEKLRAVITDEQKELFDKYADCVREYQTITDGLIFQSSFKLGARMMLEVMEE